MTPERPRTPDADLVERFARTLVELARKLEQLEVAFEPFADAANAFAAAWTSEDPDERNRAELVHATFERVHQLLVDLVDLASRLGDRRDALPALEKGQTRAQRLAAAGVLSWPQALMLADHADVRNEGQHAYVEQGPVQVWTAAGEQLARAPAIATRIDRRIDSLGVGVD